MVIISNLENLSAASGILNIPFLEQIYHSFMDEALQGLGGNRGTVVFHLPPQIQQDNTVTQKLPAPQQYNPFFGRVPVPKANTRNAGVFITPRDVQYTALISIGPRPPNDKQGIGELKMNQCSLTVVIEALQHVQEALSVSVEGRRYTVTSTRPHGFSQRRYIIVELTEIQETEHPVPDITMG